VFGVENRLCKLMIALSMAAVCGFMRQKTNLLLGPFVPAVHETDFWSTK
jgi:hypothetical protein